MLVQVFTEGLQLLHEPVLLNHGLLDLPRDLLRPQVLVLPARGLHFSHEVQLRQLSLFEIPQFIHHPIVMKLLVIKLLWSSFDALVSDLELDGEVMLDIAIEEFLIAWQADDPATIPHRVVSRKWTSFK